MTEEAREANELNFSKKVKRLYEDIRAFDSVLDRIQRLMPEDVEVYDKISEVRDAVFRLQNQMRGCKVEEFATSGLDDMTYQTTLNELFWDKDKQRVRRLYEDEDEDKES